MTDTWQLISIQIHFIMTEQNTKSWKSELDTSCPITLHFEKSNIISKISLCFHVWILIHTRMAWVVLGRGSDCIGNRSLCNVLASLSTALLALVFALKTFFCKMIVTSSEHNKIYQNHKSYSRMRTFITSACS